MTIGLKQESSFTFAVQTLLKLKKQNNLGPSNPSNTDKCYFTSVRES